jgi:hypothetical protein
MCPFLVQTLPEAAGFYGAGSGTAPGALLFGFWCAHQFVDVSVICMFKTYLSHPQVHKCVDFGFSGSPK